MEKSVQITIIIVVAVLILGFVGINTFKNIVPQKNQGPTISTTGNAVIKATPDLITVYFQIVTKGQTASESSIKNTQIFDRIKTKLVAEGFKESDIKTNSFNTYEDFDWFNGYRRSLGYKTTNSLKVELNASDNQKAGKVIDLVSSENGLISYINFELSQENQNKYKSDALKAAAQDAKSKAQAIAQGSGQKLGSLVSISSSDYYYQPWRLYSNEVLDSGSSVTAEAAKAVQIQPDEKDITATITAVYKIK
jgi:uncharacterized protein YggE